MREIRIGPLAQVVIGGAVVTAVAAAIAAEAPEVQRYLKVRKM